jgi:hypothetical protein
MPKITSEGAGGIHPPIPNLDNKMEVRLKLHTPVTSAQEKGNQVAPIADLNALEKRKIICPCCELSNISSIIQPINK